MKIKNNNDLSKSTKLLEGLITGPESLAYRNGKQLLYRHNY